MPFGVAQRIAAAVEDMFARETERDINEFVGLNAQKCFWSAGVGDFVFGEDAAQRQTFRENIVAGGGGKQVQEHFNRSEFNAFVEIVCHQDNLAKIKAAAFFAAQHFEVNGGVVEFFQSRRHVAV